MSSKFARRGVRPLKPPPVCKDKDIQKTPEPPPFTWPSGSLEINITAFSGMDFDSIDPGAALSFGSGSTPVKNVNTTSTAGATVALAITFAISPQRVNLAMQVTGGPFPGTYSATAPGWDGTTLPASEFFDDQTGLAPWSGTLNWTLT